MSGSVRAGLAFAIFLDPEAGDGQETAPIGDLSDRPMPGSAFEDETARHQVYQFLSNDIIAYDR